MSTVLMLFIILLPMAAGGLVRKIPFPARHFRLFFTEGAVLFSSALTWGLATGRLNSGEAAIYLAGNLTFSLESEKLGLLYAILIGFLWVVSIPCLLLQEAKQEKEADFLAHYLFLYGGAMGMALSGNFTTAFLFFEVMCIAGGAIQCEGLSREQKRKDRKWFFFSGTGTLLGVVAAVGIRLYGAATEFQMGGILDPELAGEHKWVLLGLFFFAGVSILIKTVAGPWHCFLQRRENVPKVWAALPYETIQTAVLFLMLRLSYETFGTEILEGSWAQRTIFFLCAVGAVLFGIFSVREKEWKKRLIFVSLGNLCCSIFGIMLLSGLGFVGGTMCMLFHGILFTCAFFNAGIAASLTGKTKVDEMDGVGKQIPWVFACFTITALSIMGLPGLTGFLGKWYLGVAAVYREDLAGSLEIALLFMNGILAVVSLLQPVLRGYFPIEESEKPTNIDSRDNQENESNREKKNNGETALQTENQTPDTQEDTPLGREELAALAAMGFQGLEEAAGLVEEQNGAEKGLSEQSTEYSERMQKFPVYLTRTVMVIYILTMILLGVLGRPLASYIAKITGLQ